MGAFAYTQSVENRMSFLIRAVLASGSGLLMWLAQAPVSLWPLVFLSLGTLWISVYRTTIPRSIIFGFLWGLCFFIPNLAWAAIAANSVLALVALAFSQSLFLAVLGAGWSQISYLPHVYAWISGAIAWAGIEHLRGIMPFGGMPWGKIAFAMNDSPFVRLAPIGSTLLVALAVSALSILIASSICTLRKNPYRAASSLALACLLFCAPLLSPIGGKPEATVNVGIVQGNSPIKTEIPDGWLRALQVTRNHAQMARTLNKADLVVFPESTSDRDIRTDPEVQELVNEMSHQLGVPIVLGTQQYLDNGRYNDYLVVEPGGSITARYSKQHPVPFGEYIPLRSFLSDLSNATAELISQVHIDMLPGESMAQLTVTTAGGELRMATPICFEVAYDDIVAAGVMGNSAPADIIVVPTNNASFGDSGEPYQQFEMTRFRAVEHGRSAIQVSTTGVSGLIDPNGVVRYTTNVAEQHAVTLPVILRHELTFATRTATYRYYCGHILAVLTFALAGFSRRRNNC